MQVQRVADGIVAGLRAAGKRWCLGELLADVGGPPVTLARARGRVLSPTLPRRRRSPRRTPQRATLWRRQVRRMRARRVSALRVTPPAAVGTSRLGGVRMIAG